MESCQTCFVCAVLRLCLVHCLLVGEGGALEWRRKVECLNRRLAWWHMQWRKFIFVLLGLRILLKHILQHTCISIQRIAWNCALDRVDLWTLFVTLLEQVFALYHTCQVWMFGLQPSFGVYLTWDPWVYLTCATSARTDPCAFSVVCTVWPCFSLFTVVASKHGNQKLVL